MWKQVWTPQKYNILKLTARTCQVTPSQKGHYIISSLPSIHFHVQTANVSGASFNPLLAWQDLKPRLLFWQIQTPESAFKITTNEMNYHMFRANCNRTLEEMLLFWTWQKPVETFETCQKLGSSCLPVLLRLGSLGPETLLPPKIFTGNTCTHPAKTTFRKTWTYQIYLGIIYLEHFLENSHSLFSWRVAMKKKSCEWQQKWNPTNTYTTFLA